MKRKILNHKSPDTHKKNLLKNKTQFISFLWLANYMSQTVNWYAL